MAVLARIALAAALAASACYSPDLRDCTVTCIAATECAADQVCGADGFCASPAMAGNCPQLVGPDARDPDASPPDAAPPDAPPPDAAPPPISVELRIEIKGEKSATGQVVVSGLGSCAPIGNTDVVCVYTIPAGPLALLAVPNPNARFDKWESGPCDGQGASCSTVAEPPKTTIKARFKRLTNDDDDD
jgi:hypothetical protein